MLMAVLSAQGTVITFNDGTTAQTVGGAISYSFGDGEATDIDITTLASTAKEWFQGLQDNGNLSIALLRDYADAGQSAMDAAKAAQATREVIITVQGTPNVTITFDAYVKSISTDASVDDVLRGTANLKISGDIAVA